MRIGSVLTETGGLAEAESALGAWMAASKRFYEAETLLAKGYPVIESLTAPRVASRHGKTRPKGADFRANTALLSCARALPDYRNRVGWTRHLAGFGFFDVHVIDLQNVS